METQTAAPPPNEAPLRLAQIKAELQERLPRCAPQSDQIIVCGRLLLEMKEQGYHHLDHFASIEEWASGILHLKKRQADKYITVGKLLAPKDFVGKTLGIEKLYELALGKTGKPKQADPGSAAARALTSGVSKLERILTKRGPLTQEAIDEALIAIDRLNNLRERLLDRLNKTTLQSDEAPAPPEEPNPVLTPPEITILYPEIVEEVSKQNEEDKAPLRKVLDQIAEGYVSQARAEEAQEELLKIAKRIDKNRRKTWCEQAKALSANLRAGYPQAATFARNLLGALDCPQNFEMQ